jgi:hypothetical protein
MKYMLMTDYLRFIGNVCRFRNREEATNSSRMYDAIR